MIIIIKEKKLITSFVPALIIFTIFAPFTRFLKIMFPAFQILIKGIVVGLSVSIPVGPVGILLVNRTLKRGLLSGFFSGMGLAVADTILAIIAGLGFSFIIGFLQDEKVLVGLVSGLVILVVGIKIFVSNPVKELRKQERGNKTLMRDFLTVLVLSLTNPFTIFVFVAFFSALNLNSGVREQLVPFLFIPGIFIGTLSWWMLLSYFVSRFKRSIRPRNILRVNQIAGIAIIVIGIIVILGIFTTILS